MKSSNVSINVHSERMLNVVHWRGQTKCCSGACLLKEGECAMHCPIRDALAGPLPCNHPLFTSLHVMGAPVQILTLLQHVKIVLKAAPLRQKE